MVGGGFELASRYANTMSIFLVCYMYSTGMPIMLLIGSINFYITYWVDKFLFIKYYRVPPRYTTDISKYSTALFKYILLIHLIMALWTLCNSDYFVTKNVGYKVSILEFTFSLYLPLIFTLLYSNIKYIFIIFTLGVYRKNGFG